MARKTLLICGLLASLLYIGADILAAMVWEEYSYVSHSASELMAVEAPTRPLLYVLFLVYNGLMIAFGLGIWRINSQKPATRITGALIIVYGLQGFAGLHFPMHSRGVEAAMTTTDFMHIVFTIVTVLLILLFIGFGAFTHGKRFLWYSIATLFVILLFGILGGLQGPRVAEGLPTPWLGIIERVNIYAAILWIMALALVHLQTDGRQGAESPKRETDYK